VVVSFQVLTNVSLVLSVVSDKMWMYTRDVNG